MSDLYAQCVADEAACALAAEEILCANCLSDVAIEVLEVDLDGVVMVDVVGFEAGYGPRSLNSSTVLFEVFDENSLDQTLVEECCERIPCIKKVWTTGRCTCPYDFASWRRIPKRDFKNSGRIVGHDLSFQTHVFQDF